MRRININERFCVQTIKFPDGQYHVELDPSIKDGEDVTVVCSIKNPVDLYLLPGFSEVMMGETRVSAAQVSMGQMSRISSPDWLVPNFYLSI